MKVRIQLTIWNPGVVVAMAGVWLLACCRADAQSNSSIQLEELRAKLIAESLTDSSDEGQPLVHALDDESYRSQLLEYAFLDTFSPEAITLLENKNGFLPVLVANKEWLADLFLIDRAGNCFQLVLVVAEDTHEGFAGNRSRDNVYHLVVKQKTLGSGKTVDPSTATCIDHGSWAF